MLLSAANFAMQAHCLVLYLRLLGLLPQPPGRRVGQSRLRREATGRGELLTRVEA